MLLINYGWLIIFLLSFFVRRAFLCGDDKYTGNNYDHRRGWVESLILELTEVFAIDVAAYAVMSNHLHVVLHIDIETVNRWSDRDVIEL